MKAIRVDEAGSYDALRTVEMEKPELGPGQVLVKTAAISVNFADTMVRRGIYPGMPPFPLTPGLEASGTVEAVGEGVTRLSLGQRVVVFGSACYAEYVTAPEVAAAPLPEGVEFGAAAALPVIYLTAYHMLHTMAKLPPGSTVLVRAAAGGVGTAAGQLCRQAGIRAIGTTSSAEKAAFARRHGYSEVILYTEENVVERVKELTAGRGVDVVLDAVAGEAFADDFEMLAPMGQIIWFGMASGMPEADIGQKILEHAGRSAGVRFFVLYSVPPDRFASSMRDLLNHLADGKINPHIHATFPLEEAPRAHELLESKAVMGKVLLEP
ncbi:MAG: zinc-binding dehydrogenase [bacterium]|nr:zinc-binding dehydrogenase [bacterium]